MSRESSVYEYFKEEDGFFICLCSLNFEELCHKKIAKLKTGGSSSNLKRHLQRHHKDIYVYVEEKDKKSSSKKIKLESSKKFLENYLTKTVASASITVSKKDFESGILKMLVYNGVSFNFFQEEGFMLINGQLAKKLEVPVGRENIKRLLQEKFVEEKEKLKKVLLNKLVFLKFDSVTRMRSHFLGLTVQFYCEKNFISERMLSLVDTHSFNDSESIKNYILETLKDFNLELSQVLGCVVDNAANMTRAIKLLNIEVSRKDFSDSENSDSEYECESYPAEFLSHEIFHMRCMEHTLQLGVKDGLKIWAEFLSKIRDIASRLRAPHTDAILKRRSNRSMIIDTPTRWGSTYLMLKRLYDLKEYIEDLGIPEIEMNVVDWKNVTFLISILKIIYQATLYFQQNSCTASEVSFKWKETIFNLEALNDKAHEFVNSLKSRERKILENKLFVAAIWIDARTRNLLSVEQKQIAQKTLEEVNERMASSLNLGDSSFSDENNCSSLISKQCASNEKNSKFQEYLQTLDISANQDAKETSFLKALNDIEKLGNFRNFKNVWDIIDCYPDITKLTCQTVTALPATQISVERLFSQLKLILRNNRSNMNKDILNSILFLRMNKLC